MTREKAVQAGIKFFVFQHLKDPDERELLFAKAQGTRSEQNKSLNHTRAVLVTKLHEEGGYSMKEIGEVFGGRRQESIHALIQKTKRATEA